MWYNPRKPKKERTMLTPYEEDLLGSQVRGTDYFIAGRVPKDEWDSNKDLARIEAIEAMLDEEILDESLEYGAISRELDQIRAKYEEKPRIISRNNKQANDSRQTAKAA
jgi:hypothetical protein